MPAPVYLVHCIDTEGPLFESLDATFERINNTFDLQLEPSWETLKNLQNGKLELNGRENELATMLQSHLLNYNESWEKIEAMLSKVMAPENRNRFLDSSGGGWVYNWFCVDHLGYDSNPRNRDIGFAQIYDRYVEYCKKFKSPQDGIYFHYHPVNFDRAAHHCATHYFASSFTLFSILAYRIIERQWFSSCYRPGFHLIRPDSHWFLEQFIPFDYSNQRCEQISKQPDLSDGRFGDWRRAPDHFIPYHPDHDDWESEGNCRRWIARCLNLGTRIRNLKQAHLEQAFEQASRGKPTVLGMANHDYRDIEPDVQYVNDMLNVIKERFPMVPFYFSDARSAMRMAMQLSPKKAPRFSVEWKENCLRIESDSEIFGTQPFMAFKTLTGKYRHDNLDIQKPKRMWTYTFDEHSMSLNSLSKVGWAANDSYGNTTVVVVDIQSKEYQTRTI